jgi:tetratricopeptide (TPR) repeat protein
MAEVFLGNRLGSDGKLGPTVAVKRLLPHLADDLEIVRMFVNEARITAQIDHPNVIRVTEVGEHERKPFIAMELLEGASFASLRDKAAERGARVPLPVALRILIDASRGLDAAHRATDDSGQRLCIVHRDYTPDNVHVGSDGRVKVLDFGIAKTAKSAGTEPGTLKGKYFYMSPEMISGNPVDHRADVFAAGAMLYEQLCGRRPFTGTSTAQVLLRISSGELKRPREFDPSVPHLLEAACLKALSRDPEARFDTLAELCDVLETTELKPATVEEVAACVHSLVPQDEKRKRVRAAKAANPARLPRAVEFDEPPRRGGLFLALLVLAAGGGAAYWKFGPKAAPADRLARARSDQTLDARAGLADLPKDPRTTEAQAQEACELLLEVNAARPALELLDAAEARWPKSEGFELIEAKAATAARLGKRAENALDRASQIAPGDPRPDLERARLRSLQGDLSGAMEASEAGLRKAPDDRNLVLLRADLLIRSAKLDQADALLSRAIAQTDDPQMLAERAFIALQRGRAREAASELRRVVRRDPELAVAHYFLGTALVALEDNAAAARELQDADRRDPSDTRALRALIDLSTPQHRATDAAAARALLATRESR